MAYIPANRDLLLSEHVVAQIANKTSYASDVVAKVLDEFSSFIVDALCAGYNVELQKLGTFYLQKHKGHTMPNGAFVDDYASIKFYPAKDVRDDVHTRTRQNKVVWTKDDISLHARPIKSCGRPVKDMDDDAVLSNELVIKDLMTVNERIAMLKEKGSDVTFKEIENG